MPSGDTTYQIGTKVFQVHELNSYHLVQWFARCQPNLHVKGSQVLHVMQAAAHDQAVKVYAMRCSPSLLFLPRAPEAIWQHDRGCAAVSQRLQDEHRHHNKAVWIPKSFQSTHGCTCALSNHFHKVILINSHWVNFLSPALTHVLERQCSPCRHSMMSFWLQVRTKICHCKLTMTHHGHLCQHLHSRPC